MTDQKKRTLIKTVALSALASAALIGCGKKEEPAPAPAPAPVAEAPKPEPLKIAFAYVGPVGDGGWTFAHDNGRKAIEAEFGDKVKTSFVESVPESADAERVIRDMAQQGNKLIFGTTFGYMEPMLKVAPDFKDVTPEIRPRLRRPPVQCDQCGAHSLPAHWAARSSPHEGVDQCRCRAPRCRWPPARARCPP